MWLLFVLAVLVSALFLYLPGYLITRALTRDRMEALAIAPLTTTAVFSLLCIAFGAAGIYTSWLTLMVPTTVAGIVLLVIFGRKRSSKTTAKHSLGAPDTVGGRRFLAELKVYLPYLVMGIAVCLLFFVKTLDGPQSLIPKTDTTKHLNLVWRFVQTGNWSMLATSTFENPALGAQTAGYYPAAWHIFPAMICQAFGQKAAFSSNAFNAALVAFSLPTAAYYFLRTVLAERPLAVRLGAILPLAFCVFPWELLLETKFAFVLGIMATLVCITLFYILCENALQHKPKGKVIALLIISLASCLLIHPSGIFSFGALLVPYFITVIWRASTAKGSSRAKGILLSAGFIVFVCVVWVICYNLPGMHGITKWGFPAYASKQQAIAQAVFLGFKYFPPELLLAIFAWLGAICSLYRRQYLWLTTSFVIFLAFFALAAIHDGFITHFLTGFWYSDYKRISSMACMMALPLAALGLEMCVRLCQYVFTTLTKTPDEASAQRFGRVTIPLIAAFVAACVMFYPNFNLPEEGHNFTTAFGTVTKKLSTWNSFEHSNLPLEEIAFLKDVKKKVGDDLVLNLPGDGSVFAYATNDINVYYRRYGRWNTEEGGVFAGRLYKIGTDKEVQDAAKKLGARYVLLLDENPGESSTLYYKLNKGSWKGFFKINDETPGLETVLAEGDMRLFKITV